jgi:hypothetical protein
VLDDLTPLHQLSAEVARAGRHLFRPRDAWRVRGGGGFGGRPVGVGQNPPNGAVVRFYLRAVPDSEVRLQFLDARDSLIRAFSTRPAVPGDSLPVVAGMNRFVWNLRYPDASRFPGLIFWGGGTQGPVVPPGRYKARLTVGGWSETRELVVVKDPRVTATEADLQQQFELLLRIRDRVTAANDAVRRIREVREQVTASGARARRLPGDGGRTIRQAADSLTARLTAVEEAIYQTKNRSSQDPLNYPIRLNNKLAGLTSIVSSADARPTQQARRVFEELSAALQVELDRLQSVLATGIPAFNRLVKEQDVPAIIER